MSTTCKYCNGPEDKQDRPGLVCESCECFVHLSCLRRPGTPGDFSCDVFFDYTCEDCSPDKKEYFNRNKFPWVNVILLTLHHLNTQSYGISNHGFFHYKTHICSFIDRHWHLLFEVHFKQKKNWIGTIAGALSVYNNLVFKSGSVVLGETGWWRLQHSFSPAVAAKIIQEMAKDRPKGRQRNQLWLDKAIFISKVAGMGYKHLLNNDQDNIPISVLEPSSKKRRVDLDELSGISGTSYYDQFDSDSRNEIPEEITSEPVAARENSFSDVESTFRGFDFAAANYVPPSDSSSIHSFQPSFMHYDSDSRSRSPNNHHETSDNDEKPKKQPETKIRKATEEKPVVRRESLFSSQLNSVDLPWVEQENETPKDLVEMSQYEEVQLLKQVEGMIGRVTDPNKKALLCRMRAKLALRRLKRHKHLPLFNLDKTVRLLGGYVTDDPRVATSAERILDRFQRSDAVGSLCGTISAAAAGPPLVAPPAAAPLRSPLSGAALRPYIRRDRRAQPLWLRLMDELLVKTNKHIPNYKPPPRATLDYSYVRPQHIAAVNSLCAQFFWPGIDLTEALQYPEHSCVVTYRRVVVGCGFLVPDVGPCEGYLSFLLTRPAWRRSGVATFMLYHLLQTCAGKDVTLHVSPTNPAIFLYQKFGFKVNDCSEIPLHNKIVKDGYNESGSYAAIVRMI